MTGFAEASYEIERWVVKLMREVARRSQDRNQNRGRTLSRSLWAALHALSRGPKVYHEYKYKDPAGPEPNSIRRHHVGLR